MDMFLLILLQIFLIFLNAVFACAEIAVLSVNETILEKKAEEGNRRAKRLFKLTREPAKFLATIQVAITLSGFLGSAFAADNFAEPLVDWVISLGVSADARGVLNTAAVILITLILSYFTLVFGELVPKRIAMKNAEKVALGMSGVVSGISVVFKPLVALLSASTNLILRLFGIDPNAAEEDVDESEILMMVDAGSEQGVIESHEREMIQNVFDFNDITVSEVVTRRADVIFLREEDSDEEWLDIINNSRHTLYPVCSEDIDNITGILNTKDFFRLSDKSRESVMENAVYEPYFVPENITADVLFRNMKSTRNSLAVVIDEYGSMEGIVTFADLLEEIVGEINDDTVFEDDDKPHLVSVYENKWHIFGNMALEDITEQTGIKFSREEFDTISGICFDFLGEIPENGECDITVELVYSTVQILFIDSHCIAEAYITKKEIEDNDDDVDE